MATVVDILSITLGAVALLVSVLAYVQSRPSQQLKRDQQAAMHTLASEVLLAYNMMNTIATMIRGGLECDPFLLELMRSRVKSLHEAMYAAIRLRLWEHVVGEREHALLLFDMFCGNLFSAASEGSSMEEWVKEHFVFGLTRVMMLCEEYHLSLEDEPLGPLLTSKVADFSDEKKAMAWEYVHRRVATRTASPSVPAVGTV